MVSLIYLGKENPISYKTVFGMDAFDRHDTDGGNQTADSASDIKVYPESASGCLINDLGKLLNMNPDFYRRRIRRIRPAAIAVGLSAICLIAIFLIPSESNPVFQNFFSALFGFFLGLASSAYEKFRKWHKYFRNGMTEPGLQPLSNERKRRKRLHYLESLSRCVFMLEPYQATLDYLLDYSDKILGEKIRQDKILKGYLQPVGGIYIYQKNVGK